MDDKIMVGRRKECDSRQMVMESSEAEFVDIFCNSLHDQMTVTPPQKVVCVPPLKVVTPVELAALFHYRYIRIHPFEDGNGRIARLMVNFILARHRWPMIVVRNRKKQEYLEALHQSDLVVGKAPSEGSHASLNDIRHFLHYFQKLVQTEIQSDIDFVEAEGEEFWWYDGERIQFRSPNASHVLNALQLYPDISIARLAERIGINKSAMQKLLKTMTDKGYITRSEKDGKWHVVAVSTK